MSVFLRNLASCVGLTGKVHWHLAGLKRPKIGCSLISWGLLSQWFWIYSNSQLYSCICKATFRSVNLKTPHSEKKLVTSGMSRWVPTITCNPVDTSFVPSTVACEPLSNSINSLHETRIETSHNASGIVSHFHTSAHPRDLMTCRLSSITHCSWKIRPLQYLTFAGTLCPWTAQNPK